MQLNDDPTVKTNLMTADLLFTTVLVMIRDCTI